MKKVHLILGLLAVGMALTACGEKKGIKPYNEGCNIIPTPQSLVADKGKFKLKRGTKIAVLTPNEELNAVANFFIEKINTSTGYALKLDDNATKNVISIALDSSVVTEKEGYRLEVKDKNVTIVAATPQGAYYAMQTFLQLLPAEIESPTEVSGVAWVAPEVVIVDAPRFQYRGIMFDVCRHFRDVDFLKKQIDVLSMLKINRLHLHLTDDQLWAIEIKKYPKLAEIGSVRTEGEGTTHSGYYTQEQLKELVAYANQRYVEIIPEIELPGHALAALKGYPEYSCTGGPFEIRNVWGVEEDVYCAGNDATFQFLEDILSEVAPLFTSEYIHIGGDECPKDRWKKCPKCQSRMKKEGLKNETELQSYFVQRIEKHVNKLGKKIIGWDEILEGGIAPSATIMSWRGEEGGIEAANADHDVIMTPGEWLYLDRYQGAPEVEPMSIGGFTSLEKTYGYNPVPEKIAADKAHRVIGVQGNMWAEYLYEPALTEYRLYPRAVAVAEIGWTNLDRKNYKDFERRINNMYVRLDAHQINYHIPMPEGPVSDYIAFVDTTTLTFQNRRGYKMVYSLDGTEPTITSTEYTTPIALNKETIVKIATVLPSNKMSRVRTLTVMPETYSAAFIGNTTTGITKRTAPGHYLNAAAYRDAKFSEPVVVAELKTIDFPDGDVFKEGCYVDLYEGYFEVPEDAVYTFATDMEQLWIDGTLVVDNDNKVSRHYANKSTKALAKGKHAFKLIFNNSTFGGWPESWNLVDFEFKAAGAEKYTKSTKDILSH